MATIREQLDSYVMEKYQVEPEILPFSHEDYAIYRHTDTGKWFAVFIVKDRQTFGLPGTGDAEIVSFKIKDSVLADLLAQQQGYLRGFPSSKWSWLSAVLDGTISFEDICHWIDMSYLIISLQLRLVECHFTPFLLHPPLWRPASRSKGR